MPSHAISAIMVANSIVKRRVPPPRPVVRRNLPQKLLMNVSCDLLNYFISSSGISSSGIVKMVCTWILRSENLSQGNSIRKTAKFVFYRFFFICPLYFITCVTFAFNIPSFHFLSTFFWTHFLMNDSEYQHTAKHTIRHPLFIQSSQIRTPLVRIAVCVFAIERMQMSVSWL